MSAKHWCVFILGGLQYKGSVDASTSLDTITSVGTYSIQSNHVDSPTGGHYAIMAIYIASSFLVQLVTDMNESSTFIRACWGGVWKQWRRLDNFGCSTATDLASLLGGLYSYNGGTSTNLITTGFYYTSDLGFLLVFNNTYYPEIAFQVNLIWNTDLAVKVRRTTDGGSTWTAWKEL